MSKPEIDTLNMMGVGLIAGKIGIMLNRPMTPEQAINCAAWLVCLAQMDAPHKFQDVLEAIEKT